MMDYHSVSHDIRLRDWFLRQLYEQFKEIRRQQLSNIFFNIIMVRYHHAYDFSSAQESWCDRSESHTRGSMFTLYR